MSALPVFRTHRVPRRDTFREWFGITVSYVVFFGILWGAYELSVYL